MPGKVFDVLNEIVVDRGSNPYLSKIECYEHDRLITKVCTQLVYFLTRDTKIATSLNKQEHLSACCKTYPAWRKFHCLCVLMNSYYRYKVMEL